MGTGLIVAFVVAVWAAYFVPLALRRYDEASKTSSLEHLSPLSRVISRTSTRESTEETAPEVESVQAPSAEEPPAQPVAASPRRRSDSRAARIAAKRRRRTLLTLILLTAIVGGLSTFGVVPVWSVVFPVALVVAWLVACRVQVRGELGLGGSGRVHDLIEKFRVARAERAEEAARHVGLDDEETVIVSGLHEEVDPARRHVMQQVPLETDALDEQLVIAVPSVATSGEAVWDPLPVTLPTYVTKPRAGRTVRTIDFAQPGAWTSGHVEGEDAELPGHAVADEPAPRRAANE